MQELDVDSMQKGRNEIFGEAMFINRMEYETAHPEEKIWEAHRVFYDIHRELEGEERVQISPRSAMTAKKAHNPDGDYQLFGGAAQQELRLTKGTILICEPEDVHKVGIAVNAPETIQKMVLKVKYNREN